MVKINYLRSFNLLGKLFLLAFLSLGCSNLFAQNLSNRGTDFWVSYGHHQFMETGTNTQEMVLYLSTDAIAATVTVEIDSSGVSAAPATRWRRTYTIPPFTVYSIEDNAATAGNYTTGAGPIGAIPKSGTYDCRLYTDPPPVGTGGEGLFRKRAIHITSNTPIVAYSHIYGSASSGATMLMPSDTWGYSYTSINSEQNYQPNCYSWMYVIAKEDNTVVTITPSVITRLGKAPGTPFNISLQKGHVYQLIGQTTGSSGLQLTGTTIKSIAGPDGECHKIACFSGSSRTSGESTLCGTGGGDNDMQQMFPETAWGKVYLTAPFSNSGAANSLQTCVYKVAVKDPTTVVKRNGTQLTGLVLGKYYVFASNTADFIQADKPVTVAQFMTGGTCNGGLGDPEMVFLSPIEQATPSVGFYRNTKESITVNYLTLIVPTSGVSSLRIDGSSVWDYQYTHTNYPNRTVVVKRWTSAKAQCIVKCDSGFNAVTYGMGSVESYAYNAGTYINNLNAISDLHNTLDTTTVGGVPKSHDFNCVNSPVKLSALIRYQPTKLIWKVSALGAVITPNADVTMDPVTPYYEGTVTKDGILFHKYTLPGTYVFNTAGTYKIELKSTSPTLDICNNTEDLSISIIVKPTPTFAMPTFSRLSDCTLDTVRFVSQPKTTENYTISQWKWDFGTNGIDSVQNPNRLFAPGSYSPKLTIVSTDGCGAEKTITPPIVIAARPTAGFTPNPLEGCIGQNVVFTPSSAYSGTSPIQSWNWNTGSGFTTSPTNANQNVTYNTAGSFPVMHFIKVSDLCVSDTITKTIVIAAKGRINLTYPQDCLDASGTAQFTASSTSTSGAAVTTYAWNFGDPASGAANTSTQQNPVHNYTAFGVYNVTLTFTTSGGCNGDSTFQVTVNTKPEVTLTLPASATSACVNAASYPINFGAITNGVPKQSDHYEGPGTSLTGTFDPAAAGPGVHTVKYIYVSTGNCSDTATAQITVYARPKAEFTFPSGCLNETGFVQFTNISTISDAQTITTYAWNFGDAANATAPNPNTSAATSPSHIYKDGTYTITLTATTNNGCSKDTVVTTAFNVKPDLAYGTIAPVCDGVAPFSVATATVQNAVTGAGVYDGPGVSTTGIFTPSTAGPGTHNIRYIFTSPGGCKDTAITSITVNPKPYAAFNAPAGCTNTSGTVQFTNQSASSLGEALTYAWDFGDAANSTAGNPNTSTDLNPSHNFKEGTYTIKLTVTTASNCVKDSSITINIGVTPAINFGTFPSACGTTGTVNVATATITNGVTGNGVYSGNGISAAGIFDPSIAGPGTHTITYTFTSTGGCVGTATSSISVGAPPVASFNESTGCSTGLTSFTNNSTPPAGFTIQGYVWDFGDPASGANNTSTATSPTHTYATEGTYTVKLTATASNGCPDDSVRVITVKITPVINYPALAPICGGSTATVNVATATITNGVTGSGTYSGGAYVTAAGVFDPVVAGPGTHNITYTFISTGGCTSSQSSSITIGALPTVAFTPNTSCTTGGMVQFTNNSTAPSGTTIQSYSWDFGEPSSGANNTSSLVSPSHTYAAEGTYNVKLIVTLSNNCSKELIVPVTVKIQQPVVYNSALPSVCSGASASVSVATATPVSGTGGTGVYSGAGVSASGMFDPVVAGPGPHTITYTFTTTGGCVTSQTNSIIVGEAPSATFTPNSSCTTGGQVTFTNNSAPPAGYTITGYVWDFGEPSSGANNTNSGVSPSHTYAAEGTYNVKLIVSASNGCSKEIIIPVTVAIQKPVVYSGAIPAICSGSVTTVNVASATPVTGNGGTGVYSGTGVTAAGVFDATQAPGTYTITYTFTTTGGCITSGTNTITINPKPSATFNVESSICMDAVANITNITPTIASGSVTTYYFNFDDGYGYQAYNSNASFTKSFTVAKTYNIKLYAVSDNGCSSDTVTRTLVVNPLPVVNFDLPTAVCFPSDSARFVNRTTIQGNGAINYTWNYGEPSSGAANTSTNVNGAHLYSATGSYPVTLTATSATGGCTATITKSVTSFYPKPTASFTVNADTLCQGAQSLFTDASTGTIASRRWTFGDNTTSSATNPSKTYTTPGTYPVTLTVTTAQGCTDDTTKNVIVYVQPVVDAGPSFVVNEGTIVTFMPKVNQVANVNFLWTSTTGTSGLSSTTSLNPTLTVINKQVYYLTATGLGKCTAKDSLSVTPLRPLRIPNAFSPNGDRINDTWEVDNLKDYPGSTVEIFNRYGQVVFKSAGYSKAWDGTYNGKPLPLGTYYYIIDPKNNVPKYSGYVVLLK